MEQPRPSLVEIQSPEKEAQLKPLALFGTSVTQLNQMLRTGQIPPQEVEEDNVVRRTVGSPTALIYYMYPFASGLPLEISGILEYRHKPDGPFTPQDLLRTFNEINPEKMVKQAQEYAEMRPIQEAIFSFIGEIPPQEAILLLMERLLDPGTFKTYAERIEASNLLRGHITIEPDGTIFIEDREQDEPEAQAIIDKLQQEGKLDEFRNMLKTNMQQHGVIIYFGQELLSHATFVPDAYELESELVFRADTPIPASVIVGVQFLSDIDKALFQQANPDIPLT